MKHLTATNPEGLLQVHDLQTFISDTFQEQNSAVQYNSFLIIWVLEGNGIHYMDVKKHLISNDTVYCMYPGQVHACTIDGLLKGYALSFSQEFLADTKSDSALLLNSRLFNINSMDPIKIGIDSKTDMIQLVYSMIKESTSLSKLKSEILRSLLKLFLLHLIRKPETIPDQPKIMGDVNLFNEFLALVQKHYLTMKKVTDYAELLRLHPNYLNTKVKKVTGFTASYHIQQRIVLEAKKQARWRQLTLKQVAYMLGYDDISHFSRFFKRSAGICFSTFKNQELKTSKTKVRI